MEQTCGSISGLTAAHRASAFARRHRPTNPDTCGHAGSLTNGLIIGSVFLVPSNEFLLLLPPSNIVPGPHIDDADFDNLKNQKQF